MAGRWSSGLAGPRSVPRSGRIRHGLFLFNDFNNGQGPQVATINLQTPLPAITQPVVINGVLPGGSGGPGIALNGSTASANSSGAIGLQLTSSAPSSEIDGLIVDDFVGGGIQVSGNNDMITTSYIGTSDDISGNSLYGVWLHGASGNTVDGDYIGTDRTGTVAIGNGQVGVVIDGGSTGNTIGAGDVISGNGIYGVYIAGSSTYGNTVEGDDIGTDYTGTRMTGTNGLPLGNVDGIDIVSGAYNNTIGGTQGAATRNIISGNTLDGVQLSSAGKGNTIEGNYIGTDDSGQNALANARAGVTIQGGTSGDTVGGDMNQGAANVISGNTQYGVWIIGWGTDTVSGNDGDGVYISDGGTDSNQLESDLIGTGPAGTSTIPNQMYGVIIQSGASSNLVLGSTISGNLQDGVYIFGSGTNNNDVEYCNIGVNEYGGTMPLPSGRPYVNYIGVQINAGASGNYIAGNNISENAVGVEIDYSSYNQVVSNDIGSMLIPGQAYGNTQYGINLNGDSNNTIDYNFVAFSGVVGINLQGSSSDTFFGDVLYANPVGES